MKITIENPKCTFGDLKTGDVFRPDSSWFEDDDILMVVESDYNLGENLEYDGYAINLNTGELLGFNDEEEAFKYDIEINAKLAK